MLELEASCLTPEPVLKASGHVDKFSDLMVKDAVTGTCYRADHLLRDHLVSLLQDTQSDLTQGQREEIEALRERLDELSQKEMDEMLSMYGAKAPETSNALTPAYPFNLMFATQIGPSGLLPGYLRPETAQGIFVNFKRLLEYMGGKLPFACAQIGLSFRNEISPRAGLLRVREFQQAEIEHFVNAEDKTHPKFGNIRDVKINMYGRSQQMRPPYKPIVTSIGAAVDEGIIANETLGYFIGRTAVLVDKIGMKWEHVRFRQHLEHEMAHYASDCWDLEINCSYGWVECAGLADRSAFDLGNHSEKSGQELTAREVYAEPRHREVLAAIPNKGLLGRTFKKDAQTIMKSLASMEEAELLALQAALASKGKASVIGFEVTKDQITFKVEKRTETGRNYYPSVIEPSFGVGRLLYCLWEHCYYVREGGEGEDGSAIRAVLGLRPSMAPVKCAVLPLSKNALFEDMVKEVGQLLGRAGLINRVDDSGQSIGRRYARADEIGTPFGITVDFKSTEDRTVTVRERDSTKQIRCTIENAVETIRELVAERKTWAQVCDQFGVIEDV
ncbi:unnamed protein product [Chondrus crispus]|uniref:glycine--tRNA ligase n=1 Tax=Chondrus crispus TaxID=2769 RepID=R7QUM7_CHOCR|nr:unnamed protein product [Chondrus crispus]CDF41030.1 unnamed protein product [Chondrus crispus]|eukprot:XP_005711324.1 unnamed protein product [Chondrus crispus]